MYHKRVANGKERGRPPYDDVLTPAEWRVVDAVRHGMPNARIARGLGVSLDAVKYHVGNALQKLGLTSRKELQRWNGVHKHTKYGKASDSMNTLKAFGPIGQIARTVRDIGAAREWYGDVLGLEHLYSFGNLAFYACGDVRLFLSEAEGAESESIIYFRVDDIRAACEQLAERGVKITHAPHLIHKHEDGSEEWMAFFHDNEGRPLGLMSAVR